MARLICTISDTLLNGCGAEADTGAILSNCQWRRAGQRMAQVLGQAGPFPYRNRHKDGRVRMAHRDAGLPSDGEGALRGQNESGRQQNRACAVLHRRGRNGLAPWLHEEIAENPKIRPGLGYRTQAQIGDGTMKPRKHVGSSLDELLAEDGTLAEAEAAALKRVIAWQVERGMGEKRMSKSDMARAMRTSRAALDRLLDPKNESVTLRTMARAAKVLGMRLRLELA